MKRLAMFAFCLVAIVVAGIGAWVYHGWGVYGVNGVLRHGGTLWIDIRRDDARLSPAMRLALSDHAPAVAPGAMLWREVEPGFEVAQLPVLAAGHEIERLYLHRIDPARFDLMVGNAPDNDRDLDQWLAERTKAVLVVNGSYFDTHGRPDTPVIIDGQPAGPAQYNAHAGAFVATGGAAHVVDLAKGDWHSALKGATQAMVSYPLLVGEDGRSHVTVKSRWLANRTFVGEDRAGCIIIGSSRDAFFSLDRLADFLIAAPLNLKTALNLDGGPIANLGVRLNGYSLLHIAKWEAQGGEGDKVRLLVQPVDRPNAMPMVLRVERRTPSKALPKP